MARAAIEEAKFNKKDKGNGRLTFEEFMHSAVSTHVVSPKSQISNAIFECMDLDDDGFVTLGEFKLNSFNKGFFYFLDELIQLGASRTKAQELIKHCKKYSYSTNDVQGAEDSITLHELKTCSRVTKGLIDLKILPDVFHTFDIVKKAHTNPIQSLEVDIPFNELDHFNSDS